MDRATVVTRFVDFRGLTIVTATTERLYGLTAWRFFCGGSMGFLYGFMKVAYYGLVQDFSVD